MEDIGARFVRRFPGKEPNGEAVRVGRYRIADAPWEALTLAEEQARTVGLPDYAGFLRRHAEPLPTKPTKPTADELEDLLWRKPPPARSARELRFFRSALERQEQERYFSNLKTYEAQTEEEERFRTDYPPTIAGYIKLICQKDEKLSRFFFDCYKTLPISEEDRKRHTYIVGSAGSGKTELVKTIIYNYTVRNKSTAVVVIEPHGKLAREVARWRELADGRRLVYIQPGMREHTPVFNPFDISDGERNDPRALAILVEDTIEIVAELLEREFTPNMETLMRACFNILYRRNSSTFMDVLRFVDLDENKDLIQFGRTVFAPGSPMRRFLENDLASNALAPTRQGVKMRFTNLLSSHFLYSFLIGKSTFHLEDLIKKRSVIVFNFSVPDIGATESRIFGKLIIAHLKAFGFKQGRDDTPRASIVPVHVFIDECQEFITQSLAVILEQLRKFGVHLTLIQQGIGRGMSRELEEAVLTNTAVKATGKNSEANLKRFSAETGADMEELAKLERGQGWFCIKSGKFPAVRVKIPSHRIDDRGATSNEVWQATLADQIKRFYVRRETPKVFETAEEAPPEQKYFQKQEIAFPADAPKYPL